MRKEDYLAALKEQLVQLGLSADSKTATGDLVFNEFEDVLLVIGKGEEHKGFFSRKSYWTAPAIRVGLKEISFTDLAIQNCQVTMRVGQDPKVTSSASSFEGGLMSSRISPILDKYRWDNRVSFEQKIVKWIAKNAGPGVDKDRSIETETKADLAAEATPAASAPQATVETPASGLKAKSCAAFGISPSQGIVKELIKPYTTDTTAKIIRREYKALGLYP